MSVVIYSSSEQAGTVLREVFSAVLEEEESAAKFAERQLSLHFVQHDPAVELFVDADVWEAPRIHAHPLRNDATLVLSHAALERFLAATGHVPRVVRW